MEEQAYENTDVEIWRKPGASVGMDYYQPSIHVTKENSIGIEVGGNVFVMPIEDWHELAKEKFNKATDSNNSNKEKMESKCLHCYAFVGKDGEVLHASNCPTIKESSK